MTDDFPSNEAPRGKVFRQGLLDRLQPLEHDARHLDTDHLQDAFDDLGPTMAVDLDEVLAPLWQFIDRDGGGS